MIGMSDTPDNDYPRQIYHPDGRTARVESAEEEQAAGEGWGREPSPVHQQAGGGVSAVTASDPQSLLFREVLEQVLDERGLGPSRKERAEHREAEVNRQLRARQAPPATETEQRTAQHGPETEWPARDKRRSGRHQEQES
jgi:hypothetical protein